jgi:glycerol-3-phosphate dehydrogenase
MAKGWKNFSLEHGLAARGIKSKSFVEIAGTKLTHRQMALWHAEQARKELKKKSPDYTAINYHLAQGRFHNRFRPVFVPASMLPKSDSRRSA